MPRKKKNTRADGTYEYKATLGKDIYGKAIRKSFYSSKSLADAKAKAQEYIISSQVSALTGQAVGGRREDTFSRWAMQWLETYKRPAVTQNTYHSSYYLPVTRYLIPFFGDADLVAIQPIDVQRFFNEHRDLSLSLSLIHIWSKFEKHHRRSVRPQRACTRFPCAGYDRLHIRSCGRKSGPPLHRAAFPSVP